MSDINLCIKAIENSPMNDSAIVRILDDELYSLWKDSGNKKIYGHKFKNKFNGKVRCKSIVDYKRIYWKPKINLNDIDLVYMYSMKYSTKKGNLYVSDFSTIGQTKDTMLVVHSHFFERLRERSSKISNLTESMLVFYRTVLNNRVGITPSKCNQSFTMGFTNGIGLGEIYQTKEGRNIIYLKTYISNDLFTNKQIKDKMSIDELVKCVGLDRTKELNNYVR